ncbi:MAG: ABC transporter permease subunit [Deltaproteobacteria bacterium]|nr:ABC transporter permease subunit [Deltaproteobacteria bacterium]
MLGRIWAIALNTFREAVRIKVLYGVLVVVFGANFLAIVLGAMSYHEETRVAQDIGLAGMSIFGSITAILLGLFLLYNEIQRRTVHAIVSKPIERWEFVVGKWLGMALVLSVLVALFTVAMIAMLALQGNAMTTALVKATLLAWVEVLTVAAIAIFFSSFSTPFLSGIFSFAMWLIGRVTPDIEQAAKSASAWIRVVTRVALEIVPDVHLMSPSGRSDVSVHGDFVTWAYVGMASLHGLGWIVGLLALACVLFHRRDFV